MIAFKVLVQRREGTFFAAVFLFQFSYPSGGTFHLGFQIGDGALLLGEVASNDKGLGDEVAGPSLVLLFPLFIFLDHAIGFGLPAIGGDEVPVVLHGCRPVIHEVLIHVVFVDEGLATVVGQQVFGQISNQSLG